MKTKISCILLFTLFFFHLSNGQEVNVSGTVSTASDNLPLPGVSVIVKETTKGIQTDFDGKYSIESNVGDILVFSYIGFKTQEIVVGNSSTIDISMEEDASVLDEVVVTAQGIKREKKALGYAVSTFKAEDVESKTEGDIGRILRGKASGVNITQQSGISGSATNIVIRGLNSFSQNNQPLFIVDGVPFSSDTNAVGDFVDGNNGSSRFLDLDPNNIANVSVLKGLSAATLYGEAGKNGVILITTKGGSTSGASKKTEISITSSLFFNEIASLPDYQNQYGNGFDQSFGWFFSNWGPSFEQSGPAGWGNQSAIDANGTLEHPYSTASAATGIPQAFPEFAGARYEWRPYNSVENFFRTGAVLNNSVNARGSSDDGKISYNVNFGHLSDEGFTPENNLRRTSFSFGGRAELSNNFTFSTTMNYSRTNFKTPPVAASTGNGAFGNGSSVFGHLFFTPRSVDLIGLPFQNPITGGSVYYRQNNSIQNPLWTVANASNQQLTNRFFGSFTSQYDINDNLNLIYRLGFDFYNERNTNYQNRGGVDLPARTLSGIYETYDNNNIIWDHNFILNADYDLTDSLSLRANLGATSRHVNYDRQGVSSSGQNVFGVLRHFNFDLQDEIQFSQVRNITGVYGQAEFSYNNYLFLTYNARNEWVSNFSPENRSIFYNGVSLSAIATDIFEDIKSDKLNYLKVRAAYGESAGFGAVAYPTVRTLLLDAQDFIDPDSGTTLATNTNSNILANPNLRPEKYSEIEFGLDSRLFNNRVNFGFSYFTRKTNDLIINQQTDPASGGIQIANNIGEIKSYGIEADLGVDIFQSSQPDGFDWSLNANFFRTDSEVTDLGQDTDLLVYSGFSNLGNAAIVGQPLGVFVGSRIARDANGNFLVNASGSYLEEEVDENGRLPIIGNPTPDFTLNFTNSFSYKNFNFSFLFNYVQGGDVYSRTIATLLGRGLTTDTVDREASFVLPGIDPSGNQNSVQINNSTYYFSNILFGPDELQVYDATTLRLQEIAFGYTFPQKMLKKTPFGSLSITASGFNLWYKAFNVPEGTNFDPNVAGLGVGAGTGFDFLNGPSSKRYGISIKATF